MRKYIKYFVLAGLVAFLASCNKDDEPGGGETPPPAPPPAPAEDILPKKEMRAAWIATVWSLDWPQEVYDAAGQKQKFIDYLDAFAALNINAAFVQIRPTADAFYDSPFEPWSKEITGEAGKDPGYDVLQFMIDEAHKRNIEFHAWMNPYRISRRTDKNSSFPALDSKIPAALVKDYDKIRIYNPALPEAQQRIADIVKDVITKYDVDGIHFDDYFYPDPGDYTSLDDTQEYNTYGAGYATVNEFRFGNVNKVVQKVHDIIVQEKPGVVFSISPASGDSYNRTLYADAPKWCQEGWVDIIIPQIYQGTGSGTSNFSALLNWWNQYNYKAALMIGYALYKFGDPEAGAVFQTTAELEQQFSLANAKPKVQGSVLYSAHYIPDNKIGITNTLRKLYKNPAVRPFAGRTTVSPPAPASNVRLSGATLRWNAAAELQSVVYLLPENDTKAQVVAITPADSCPVSLKGAYFVSTINRDNTESEVSAQVIYK
ncbi:MAG: family 10 glycosylhydrolase [Prevotellaceae bacterium]|jgi:uncharacterized lipoprotein YddW (UPF0748 family)|nr:family 10 glycosylhydrolase [Prevotellaceae bacterium]